MNRSIYFAVIALSAACGPVLPDNDCPAAHPGVCVALGLPDNPVLFRPCDLILAGVCQYRVFDDTLEADVYKLTTRQACLAEHFDADSVRDACAPYDFGTAP